MHFLIFNIKKVGGGGGGREGETMRDLGTDHVISGPMRGLKKPASNGANIQTDGHGDYMTESAKWSRFSGYRRRGGLG